MDSNNTEGPTTVDLTTAHTFNMVVENSGKPAIFRDKTRQNRTLDILENSIVENQLSGKPSLNAVEHARDIIELADKDIMAGRDSLTGLHNRRAFDEELMVAYARYKRRGDGLGVLMMDANKFKEVNDLGGHMVGDKVLQTIAEVFKTVKRTTDFVARFGGDEFAMVLTDDEGSQVDLTELRGEAGEGSLLYRINYKLDELLKAKSLNWNVGEEMIGDVPMRIAGGLAWAGKGGVTSQEDLFNAADLKLYEYKNSRGVNSKRI